MDQEDPAQQFFPGQEEVDLYDVLGLAESATGEEIKKAYRRLALQYHPDKVGTSEATTQKFHQIGFAYAVLNDDMRKKRYDETGRTDESFFEGEADWNAYFRELWKGEVNQKTLDEFVEKYKGSEEERKDILDAYAAHEGSLGALFENVMCSNVLEDEERFISIVNDAIKTKHVTSYPQWKKDVKDTKARQRRKEEAKGEAKEAEKLAKELGVHDKIFGKNKNKRDQDDEDVETVSSKKTKGKASVKTKKLNEDGVDEDSLRELIQSRNSKNNSMNDLFGRLEAKYGANESAGGGKKKKKGKKASPDDDGPDDFANGSSSRKRGAKTNLQEPTDEEFEALQKKLFGGKDGKASTRAKGAQEGDDDDDSPKPKKLRRSK